MAGVDLGHTSFAKRLLVSTCISVWCLVALVTQYFAFHWVFPHFTEEKGLDQGLAEVLASMTSLILNLPMSSGLIALFFIVRRR